ncbi:type II NADH:ubiquinone oxidoreductase [Hepatocystis sp. ex Piliocolobus tephrosceles]|nr:type II NADH:ubiquinone oxidoreductase [Hepatocystis sp. ex Piliocolobus tephrosceles]
MLIKKTSALSAINRIRKVYDTFSISDFKYGNEKKKRIVVLGSGWGGINFLINIDFRKYDVVLVSPRSYFTFTPLLPFFISGTIGVNTCTDKVHNFLKKNKNVSKYYEYECTDILHNDNIINCIDKNNNKIKINYDYLVISVGAKTNTFNIKGVETFALFFKDVNDALKVREKLFYNLNICITKEKKLLEDEKKKLLHIVVVGGGPTGVEVTAEIADFVNDEIKKKYKKIFHYISISIIEGGNYLLPTFTKDISEFTKQNFKKYNVNVFTNFHVIEIDKDYVYIKSSLIKTDSDTLGNSSNTVSSTNISNYKNKSNLVEPLKMKLPYGMVIWASGLAQTPLVNKFLKTIPKQAKNRAIHVNQQLKVNGINSENIYAIGDCKIIEPIKLHDHVRDIIQFLNSSKLSSEILKKKSKELSKLFPQVSCNKWCYESNKKEHMTELEFSDYLLKIDKNYKTPIPTAQNAKQEAYYLSDVFNYYLSNPNKKEINVIPSFIENWQGSLAYIGNKEAVAHLPFYEIVGGPFSFTFWKMVYLQLLLTWKAKYNFVKDYIRTNIKGRTLFK